MNHTLKHSNHAALQKHLNIFLYFLTALALLALSSLANNTYAAHPYPGNPYHTTSTFPGADPDAGGDSVTGSGDFSIVADSSNCTLNIYRLDYVTMSWGNAPFQVINGPVCGFLSSFGVSSSIAGDVLVVGMTGASGFLEPILQGGFSLYEFDGTSWVVQNVGNYLFYLDLITFAPLRQGGALFGSSVSVSRSPQNPDEYLIAVGEPLRDVDDISVIDNADDAGAAYYYRYNSALNSLDLIGFNLGVPELIRADGDLLGTAVTTDYPYALVGAPGRLCDEDFCTGAAYLVKAIDSLPTDGVLDDVSNEQTLVSGILDFTGKQVSLSPELALAGGADLPLLPGAGFGWENIAGNDNRDYKLLEEPGWIFSPAKGVRTNGGDVSQSHGIAAFGDEDSGFTKQPKLRIFRDFVTDSPDEADGDLIFIDIKDDYATNANNLNGIGEDIRIVDESLWLANSAESRAILYRFPCGYGTKLTAFAYKMVSIPCDLPPGTTVGDVFGHMGTIGNTSSIRLYRYDPSGPAKAKPTIEILNPAETFDSYGYAPYDYGFWMITTQDQYFAVPETLTSAPGFTPSDPPIPLVTPATVRRTRPLSLPQPQDPATGAPAPGVGAADFGWIMVANAFPRSFKWAELTWAQGAANGDMTNTGGRLDTVGYVYDPDIMVGQPYRAVVYDTPGMNELDSIEPLQGVWVKILEGASAGYPAEPVILGLPQPE